MSLLPSLEDPLPAHRFFVTLDPADAYLPPEQAELIPLVAVGQFTSVTGLGMTLEVLAHPEGGRNDYVHQLPVRHSATKITLSRGIVRDPGLFAWYEAGLTQSLGARRDGSITLLDESGAPAVAWAFRGGLACAWKGPELNAGTGAVAVESLEIVHEGLLQVALTAPGAFA